MKQKLLDGEKVYSISIEKRDVDLYLELRKHYDFVWFEMQHSTLTYADVEAMIKAGSMTGEPGAIPCIRMHSPATEHVFQQCGDIGGHDPGGAGGMGATQREGRRGDRRGQE